MGLEWVAMVHMLGILMLKSLIAPNILQVTDPYNWDIPDGKLLFASSVYVQRGLVSFVYF